MPIYDQSYAHWKGRLEGRILRWLPITQTGVRLAFKSKIFLLLFILGLSPFVIRFGMIVIYHYFESAKLDGGFARAVQVNGNFFNGFLMNEQIFGLIVICLFVGTPLIARDLKAGAMEVYFAKPLLLIDYLIGKFMVVAFFMACMTLLPALLLFAIDLFFSEKPGYFAEASEHLPGIFIVSFIMITVCSMIALAASSLVQKARNAGVVWFSFHIVLIIITSILSDIYSNNDLMIFNVHNSLSHISKMLFNCELSYDWVWSVPCAFILLLIIGSFSILMVRIKGAEVVK